MDETITLLEAEFLWRSMTLDSFRRPSRITLDFIRAELIWVTTQICDIQESVAREQKTWGETEAQEKDRP